MDVDIDSQTDGLMGKPDDKYLLVDGNNLLMRASFAAKPAKGGGAGLSAQGVETGSLLLFINMLAKHVRRVEPTHVSVYWDMGYAFRSILYPEYKANREHGYGSSTLRAADSGPKFEMFERAKQFLTWANVPHRARPGWEADDLIAFTARFTMGEKVILSGDRDLLQLLGPHTHQYMPNDDEIWDEARFEAKFGYPPTQYPFVKALMGDTGDNIPGLPRIGEVKAVKMMEAADWDWPTLLDTLSPEQIDQAVTFRELVDLRYLDYESKGFSIANCPTCMEFTPTGPDDMLWGALRDFLEDLEMKSVIERLEDGSLWRDPDAGALVVQKDQSVEAFSDYSSG